MTIKLSKHSHDLVREDSEYNEKYLEQIKSRTTTKPMGFVLLTLIISLVLLLQNIYLVDDKINPQFHLIMKEGNNESEVILKSMKNSLKMVSFLAQDFSVASNNSIIENIDTFDVGTKFDLFYKGYNKFAANETEVSYYKETSGLNIFEDFIQDIGIQLSKISKNENTELVHSLMITFSHTVEDFNQMYHDYKKTGQLPKHFTEDFLKIGKAGYDIENFGNKMKNYPTISVSVSIFTTMALFLISSLIIFRNFNIRYILLIFGTEFIQLTIFFCAWASQYRFYYKLNRVLHNLNLAELKVSSGYTYLQIMLLLSFVIEAIWGFVYYKSKYVQ